MQRSKSVIPLLALFITTGGLACSEGDSGNSGSGGAGGVKAGGSGGAKSGGSGGSTSAGGSGGSGTGGSTANGGAGGSSSGGAGGGSGGASGGSGGASGGSGGKTGDAGTSDTASSTDSAGEGGASTGKLVLTVTGFTPGANGRNCYPPGSNNMGNKSPKMDWAPTPAGTKTWVLSTEDITGRSVHQIVCKIPASVVGQPADVKTMVPPNAEWGVGHSNKANVGWYGPGAGGSARNYEIRIWALAVDALPMSCMTNPKGALEYLKMNRTNKAVVLDTDAKDFWGNVSGSCN